MDPAHRTRGPHRRRPCRLILAYARSRPGRLLDLVDAAGESGRLALWQHLLHDLGPDPDTVACAIETWRRRPDQRSAAPSSLVERPLIFVEVAWWTP